MNKRGKTVSKCKAKDLKIGNQIVIDNKVWRISDVKHFVDESRWFSTKITSLKIERQGDDHHYHSRYLQVKSSKHFQLK